MLGKSISELHCYCRLSIINNNKTYFLPLELLLSPQPPPSPLSERAQYIQNTPPETENPKSDDDSLTTTAQPETHLQ